MCQLESQKPNLFVVSYPNTLPPIFILKVITLANSVKKIQKSPAFYFFQEHLIKVQKYQEQMKIVDWN